MSNAIILRNQGLRVFSWLAAVASIGAIAALLVDGPPPESGVTGWLLAIAVFVVAALGFIRATRLRIEMTDGGVTAHKLFGNRWVAWQDVGDVSVDEYGVRITRGDGEVVTVGSMGKSRLWIWLKRESMADTWVRQVKAGAAAAKRVP